MPALSLDDLEPPPSLADGREEISLEDSGPSLELDLPSPMGAPPVPAPAPAAAPPPPPPPAPRAPAAPADDGIDLPTPADIDLPTPAGLDLPTPAGLDLPTPAGLDLPTPAGLDLPTPAGLDLPAPSGVDLPTPSGIDLPTPSGVDLPAPAADLPTPSLGNELQPAGHTPLDSLNLDLDVPMAPEPLPAGADPMARAPALPKGPKPVEAPAEGPSGRSRGLIYAGLGVIAVGLIGSGLYVTGMLGGGEETTSAEGGGDADVPTRDPGAPAAERHEKVLAKMALDTPKSYQQAMAMAEAAGDAVGQAEAALLLHFRYGPDPVLVGQAEKLLEPYADQAEPFVQRVVGLQVLAAGDRATADTKLPAEGPRAQLYRGWLELARKDLDAAAVAADAALAAAADDVGAIHLQQEVRARSGASDALEQLRAAVEKYPDHPRMKLTLVETLRSQGLLAEARALADDTSAGAASKAFQARILALRGDLAGTVGDRSTAILRYDQALELAPDDHDTAIARLRILMDARDYTEVKAAIEVLASENPRLVPALLLKAELAIATGEGDEALAILGEAASIDPEDARIIYLGGQVYAMRMALDDAQKAFEKAREMDPTLAIAAVDQANLLARADKVSEAIAVLETARKEAAARTGGRAGVAELLVARAHLLQGEGQTTAALAALDEALDASPGHAEATLYRGRLRMANGDKKGGREDLESLFERTGGYPGLAGPLGRLYITDGNLDALEKLLGKQLDDPRASDDVLLVGARLRREQGKLAVAKKLVDRVLEKNPGSWEGHLVRAQILLMDDDLEGAFVEIQQARPKSTDAEVEMWTGKIVEANGDPDRALGHFRLASETDPNLLEARLLYGRALAERGAAKQALAELQSVVSAERPYPEAWVAMGQAYRDMGDADKAVKAFRKASKLDPTLGEAFFWEGRLLAERNKHGPAIAALTKAVQGAPERAKWLPLAYRMLGRGYYETGNKSAAKEAYTKYLQIAPPNDPGRAEATRHLRDL